MAFLSDCLALKNARSQAVADMIGPSAMITLYGGSSAPTTPDTPPSSDSVALVVLTGDATAFGTVNNAILTANPITNGSAIATGTAIWARFSTSGGVPILDCDVGVTGSGATMILTSVSVIQTNPVQITSATFSEPGAGFA